MRRENPSTRQLNDFMLVITTLHDCQSASETPLTVYNPSQTVLGIQTTPVEGFTSCLSVFANGRAEGLVLSSRTFVAHAVVTVDGLDE